jgi:hypothetical protein
VIETKKGRGIIRIVIIQVLLTGGFNMKLTVSLIAITVVLSASISMSHHRQQNDEFVSVNKDELASASVTMDRYSTYQLINRTMDWRGYIHLEDLESDADYIVVGTPTQAFEDRKFVVEYMTECKAAGMPIDSVTLTTIGVQSISNVIELHGTSNNSILAVIAIRTKHVRTP